MKASDMDSTNASASAHATKALLIATALCCVAACQPSAPPERVTEGTATAPEPTPPTPEVAVSSTGEVFTLNPADLDDAMRRARAGDTEAAMRVARHFELGLQQQRNAYEWLELAANQGDVVAMQTLASYLADDGGAGSCARARDWLLRAQQSAATTPSLAQTIREDLAALGDCAARGTSSANR